jgi:hypothetical protein
MMEIGDQFDEDDLPDADNFEINLESKFRKERNMRNFFRILLLFSIQTMLLFFLVYEIIAQILMKE